MPPRWQMRRRPAKNAFAPANLLDKAWDLGNTSPLAMNLSQLLRQRRQVGQSSSSDNPHVEQVMRAGEAAFSRRNLPKLSKPTRKRFSWSQELYRHSFYRQYL